MSLRKNLLEALAEFDEAAQEYAFKGSKDPDIADMIEEEYNEAKSVLTTLINRVKQ